MSKQKQKEMKNYITGIKFTKPQQEIINRFLLGDKFVLVNAHHMNGGEYKWKTKNSNCLEYAGKVYRAFQNIQWKIQKAKGENILNKFVSEVHAGTSLNPFEFKSN